MRRLISLVHIAKILTFLHEQQLADGVRESPLQGRLVPQEAVGLLSTQSHGLRAELIKLQRLIEAVKSFMIHSYIKNDRATQQSFRDGWFYPGDVGMLNEQNCLIIKGRADDMMSLAGINIYPSEIERVYLNHEAVDDCVALKLESKYFGDVPVLFVTTKFSIAHHDLLIYGRQNLGIRSPRRVFIVDDLSRACSGKVDKNKLKELIADAKNVSRDGN